eukprot:Selendium_serpulae@DN11236_c0_g1_i1.p1
MLSRSAAAVISVSMCCSKHLTNVLIRDDLLNALLLKLICIVTLCSWPILGGSRISTASETSSSIGESSNRIVTEPPLCDITMGVVSQLSRSFIKNTALDTPCLLSRNSISCAPSKENDNSSKILFASCSEDNPIFSPMLIET